MLYPARSGGAGDGGAQDSVTLVFPGVAVRVVGAPGAVVSLKVIGFSLDSALEFQSLRDEIER